MLDNETMGEYYNGIKEGKKLVRKKNEKKFEPLLKQLGAVFKTMGVYELKVGDKYFHCYPAKGYGANKHNLKDKRSLYNIIGLKLEEGNEKNNTKRTGTNRHI